MASFADGIGDGFGALMRLAGCALAVGCGGFLFGALALGWVVFRG